LQSVHGGDTSNVPLHTDCALLSQNVNKHELLLSLLLLSLLHTFLRVYFSPFNPDLFFRKSTLYCFVLCPFLFVSFSHVGMSYWCVTANFVVEKPTADETLHTPTRNIIIIIIIIVVVVVVGCFLYMFSVCKLPLCR